MNRAHFGPISRQRTQASPAHAAAGPRRYNAAMHDIPSRIADVLLEIEATLRRHGRWDRVRPPARSLASPEPFCIDTLRFEQWLQWVLLPRMQQILSECRPIPARSGIFDYAEQCLRKNDPPNGALLACIRRFDELIAIQSAPRRH